MTRRMHVAAALVALVAAAACGGGTFTEKQAAAFVARADEAGVGLELQRAESGWMTREQYAQRFLQGEDRKASLFGFGLSGAHVALYAKPRGVLDALKEEPRLPEGGVVVASHALLFRDAAGADEAFDYLVQESRSREQDLVPVESDLGEESQAFAGGLYALPPPGFLFFWRSRNAVMTVGVAGAEGTVDLPRAQRLAESVAARTR